MLSKASSLTKIKMAFQLIFLSKTQGALKRKLIVTFICMVGCHSFLPAQVLFDIYKSLPDKAALTTQAERTKMISGVTDKLKQTSLKYRFDVVDEKNGFLSLAGQIEGVWEMCYWNLADGRKLVAVYYHICAPVCYVNAFDFFYYQNGKADEVAIESIIPGYKTILSDFFLKDSKASQQTLEDNDTEVTVLFNLPRKGKNIVAVFGDAAEPADYEQLVKGNRMTLLWNNGKFNKDKIFWEK